MREFKFRAWDKKRNEMVYFDLQLLRSESDLFYREQIEGNEIMMYVGLKDKYGIEIYEGDIYREDNSDNSTVLHGNLSWNCGHCGWVYGWDFEGLFNSDLSRIEIIGNIYRNPELSDYETIFKKKRG